MTKKKETLPAKVKWMQRFFKVAGEIAPASTLPVLVKLLFKPQKQTLKPPHIELLKQAETRQLKTHEFLNPTKKIKVAYYTWGQGEKLVILVHGWDAKALDYYKLIPLLLEKGYRVLAFDGPAHGQSEGEMTNLMHFKDVLYQLIQKEGTPYAIIGHSMGGGSATYLVMETDVHIKRLGLIAIPIVSKRYFEGMFNFMKVPAKMQQLFFKGMEEQVGESIDRYNLLARNELIKADKILLLNDPQDEVISQKDIKDYLKLHPEIQYQEIRDAGHNGIIKNKQVFTALLNFLEE
jgi:esterase/lipase